VFNDVYHRKDMILNRFIRQRRYLSIC